MIRTNIWIPTSLVAALLAFSQTVAAQDGSTSQQSVGDGGVEDVVAVPPPGTGPAGGAPPNAAQWPVSSPAAGTAPSAGSASYASAGSREQAPPTGGGWTTASHATVDEEPRDVSQDRILHGFRLGWLFVANSNAPWDDEIDSAESYRDHYDLRSDHHFIFGYEMTWRMVGHDWLNVLLVGNILVAGVEQSRFFPSMNGLLGFEISRTFQIGVGVSLTPTRERTAHMLAAAGWTPQVGGFYLPFHFFFVPDPYGHHRLGLTTGVNF